MALERVTAPEPDAILRLMHAFADDPRPEKIDLGVGVYRTEAGETPVMRAVKAAERRLWEEERSKGYVALAGDPAFLDAMRGLTLGDAVEGAHVAAAATPGGTGAVRQALELVRMTTPGATVWVSAPTWPNHLSILTAIGQPFRAYRYLDAESGGLDREGMRADLAQAHPGDVVLLHGCCHNPTGVDLAPGDWARVARDCAARGLLPMVDLAYQGFGDGVEADVAGLRSLARAVPELLLCVSGSKTFGLYRDRVGAVLAVTGDAPARERVAARLAGLNRQAYAFPPDHGARLVTMILADPALRADWEAELAGMRARIAAMRGALADALRRETGSDRFGFLAGQRGMFSLIGATPAQMEDLREEHALYAVQDGRINVAGLTPATVAPAARAIATVLA
ncbi:MAG: amino acid aminotransferase [Paracoccaceae bacterium]|jgi:aromatic-amino-acid transaminase|nr:amino acid aminotransferase [Paracoccaceae bacterium]